MGFQGMHKWMVCRHFAGAEVGKRFGDTIALLGDVVRVHMRSVDTSHGALYTFLKQHGLEPTIEAGKLP